MQRQSIAGLLRPAIGQLAAASRYLNPAAIVLAGSLSGCGTYDPVDPLGMQKSFNPSYRAAYEANEKAPHVYDRQPTPAERNEVRAACERYVQQQTAATIGNLLGGATQYVPPDIAQCELQHFSPLARDSAKALHNAMPGYTVRPY